MLIRKVHKSHTQHKPQTEHISVAVTSFLGLKFFLIGGSCDGKECLKMKRGSVQDRTLSRAGQVGAGKE